MAQARLAWWTEADDGVGGIGPERLVFLDECGVLTTMVRLRGRSPRGTRARASAPFGHWTRVTVLGALGGEGIVGAMSVEAATDAAVFHAYLEQVLLPELRRTKPDAVLVMDNLPAHRAPQVRAELARRFQRPKAGGMASGGAARPLRLRLPLPARLLAGPQPDRARLGQGESRVAPPRRAHGGCAARGVRPGAGRNHPARRGRVLPPLRLQPSQLDCKML